MLWGSFLGLFPGHIKRHYPRREFVIQQTPCTWDILCFFSSFCCFLFGFFHIFVVGWYPACKADGYIGPPDRFWFINIIPVNKNKILQAFCTWHKLDFQFSPEYELPPHKLDFQFSPEYELPPQVTGYFIDKTWFYVPTLHEKAMLELLAAANTTLKNAKLACVCDGRSKYHYLNYWLANLIPFSIDDWSSGFNFSKPSFS